jgi:hypothetical protein
VSTLRRWFRKAAAELGVRRRESNLGVDGDLLGRYLVLLVEEGVFFRPSEKPKGDEGYCNMSQRDDGDDNSGREGVWTG